MVEESTDWELVRTDLTAAGVDPTHFGHFVNRVTPGVIDAAPFDAAAATPVLLEWLPRVTAAPLKDAIIRHLRNPAAKGIATRALIHEFQNTDSETVRWVAGDALQYLATPAQRPLLIPLAADRTYGRGRQMLFEALGRLKTSDSELAVRAALTDRDGATRWLSVSATGRR